MRASIYRHLRPSSGSSTYRNADGDIIRTGWITCSTNTNRVPSKAKGRKGTRRAWKRAHPPGWLFKQFWS
jgi:hypothetical protein